MNKKRYSIVRVCTDNGIYRCPTNNGKCLYPKGVEVYCKKCAEINGDTKEQLIKKVAQILFKNAPKETYQPRYIEQKRKILEVAKKIVEFLGVE